MSAKRWPSVRLVFDEKIGRHSAAQILVSLKRKFIIRSASIRTTSRKHGAFHTTVEVHPEQEQDFRHTVETTHGISLDE